MATNRNNGSYKGGRTSYASSSGRSTPRKSYGKKKKKHLRGKWILIIMVVLGIIFTLGLISKIAIQSIFRITSRAVVDGSYAYVADLDIEDRPELDVELIDVNPYSRPGIALEEVKGIVVHYTANPGTSAMQNRDYFAGLAEEKTTKASSHFIIGLEGEIVQCIPCNEIAYASNSRNKDTIAIECCIEDDSGKFNKKTYESLVELVCWLMGRYDLNAEDVIRHYDVTEKICPKYYVENPEAWDQFHEDITEYMLKYGKK